MKNKSNSINHYKFSSCFRPYLLVKTPIRCQRTAKKTSPDAQAPCKHTRSGKKFSINSRAANAHRQGASRRFGYNRRATVMTAGSNAA